VLKIGITIYEGSFFLGAIMKLNVLFAALFVLTATHAMGQSTNFSPSQNMRVVDAGTDRMCEQAFTNANTCFQNWKNMGRGSDGQAGSFLQCYKVYCQAMIAGGCGQMPPFCN
jgi:hypothetical protein